MRLEYESQGGVPEPREPLVVPGADILSAVVEPAGGGTIQGAHDVEECGLPGARCPDDGDGLALGYGERDSSEHLRGDAVVDEGPGDVFYL